MAWVLSMVLAGLGGVLIAPLFELTDFTFTLVVLGSLAAVVLAGMRSYAARVRSRSAAWGRCRT